MREAFVLALMSGGMLGWGLMLDRMLGSTGAAAERLARSLILGFGVLGWLTFFPALGQHLQTPVLAAVPAVGLPGLWLLRRMEWERPLPFTVWTWLLVALIAALMLGDFLEGLSPPADADSMAYHFATPKLFLKSGGMFFIPRASDGAAPLLPQMTYMLALGLGGERAMTLWCMLTGWLLPCATYAYGRRYLDRDWSLAAAALIMSLPAILYGAGTGQVEVRTASFVLVGTAAAAESLRNRRLGSAVVAGLAAGFFLASKYTALFFVLTVGLTLLAGRGWLARCTAFAVAALLAGGQWYGWNWWNTGDPVYPMLFGLVPYRPGVPWNADQAAYMKTAFFGAELVLPQTLWWWLAYPIRVLLDNQPMFEAGRTGLGPFPLVALPFALAGAWRFRTRLAASPLLTMAVVVFLFYSLWFFFGTSQRVRHYVPLMGVVMMVLTVAVERGTRGRPGRPAVIMGIAACLMLQLAGQGLVARSHIHRLVAGESRDQYLSRNIAGYAIVPVINRLLGPHDKVLTFRRDLNYLFDVPVFYVHPHVEPRIRVRENETDPVLFWRQSRAQGITHMLIGYTLDPELTPANAGGAGAGELLALGCIARVATIPSESAPTSRALMSPERTVWYFHLVVLTPASCPLEKP